MSIIQKFFKKIPLVRVTSTPKRYWIIHPRKNSNFLNFQYDIRLSNEIYNLCKNKEVIFFDIGSAFGIFSKLVAKLNHKNRVHSVEPYMPRRLISKINLFFFKNVKIYDLFLSDNNDGKNITLTKFSSLTNCIPDIIKIDIEGNEYEMLLGEFKFLKKNKPIIFLEFHSEIMAKKGKDPKKLLKLFKEIGYGIKKFPHTQKTNGSFSESNFHIKLSKKL